MPIGVRFDLAHDSGVKPFTYCGRMPITFSARTGSGCPRNASTASSTTSLRSRGHDRCGVGQLHIPELCRHLLGLLLSGGASPTGGSPSASPRLPSLCLWHHRPHVAVKMHRAPLQQRIKLIYALHQPQTFIRDEQSHPFPTDRSLTKCAKKLSTQPRLLPPDAFVSIRSLCHSGTLTSRTSDGPAIRGS
jgi:hypothetical protein